MVAQRHLTEAEEGRTVRETAREDRMERMEKAQEKQGAMAQKMLQHKGKELVTSRTKAADLVMPQKGEKAAQV